MDEAKGEIRYGKKNSTGNLTSSYRGFFPVGSWYRHIWKNMDMRKKNICIPEKQMFIH